MLRRPKTPAPKPDPTAARKGRDGEEAPAKAMTPAKRQPDSAGDLKPANAAGPPPQKTKAWWERPGFRQEAR
jgi:hypothetical protein